MHLVPSQQQVYSTLLTQQDRPAIIGMAELIGRGLELENLQ